jgi:hypothetical protein
MHNCWRRQIPRPDCRHATSVLTRQAIVGQPADDARDLRLLVCQPFRLLRGGQRRSIAGIFRDAGVDAGEPASRAVLGPPAVNSAHMLRAWPRGCLSSS